MSAYPLSTGEAVQAVLEGRECESEGEFSWRMSLHGDTPCMFGRHTTQCVRSAHVAIRWRLVPVLVKREDALRALAAGKTIMRGRVCFEGGPEPWALSAIVWLAECMFDESACWEVLP